MKNLVLILLCSISVASAFSQNTTRPKISGPNGLFINSFNGVLFFEQTDLETKNTAMPMQLRFYYNSSANKIDYGYGLGFSLGYEMRYKVEANGDVTIETGDGRTDTYTRFGDEFEAPAGVFSTLTLDGDKYTLTEKTGEKYEFADAGHKRLTAQADRHGNQTTLTYSPDSLLTQIQDAVGHTITLEYSNKLLTRASASFHNGSITYAYDSKNRLIRRTDAMGYNTLYDYDSENHIDEITDAEGHKTNIFYNASGMVSRLKTEVSDKSIRYDGDKTVFIDYTEPQNQYSYYRWDDKGRVIEKAGLCCGIQSKLEYDEDDNVIKQTDANGNINTYTYDDRGNMLSVTDALGNTELYTYEGVFNHLSSFRDKNGNEYLLEYNNVGDLVSLSGPEGLTNYYTYDEHGWMMTSKDANGNVMRATYNTDGSIASIMDAMGCLKSLEYDNAGNIVTVTTPNNQQIKYSYNANNKVVSQTDVFGNITTLSYDKKGNVVRKKNAKQQITAFTYDALRRVLTQTNAMGGIYSFEYDGMGNLVSVTDPMGQKRNMTYNEKNKITKKTNNEGENTFFDYDAKGNLTTVFQANGNVINIEYGPTDLIEIISDNIGVIAKFTYDNNGNRISFEDGLGRITYYNYDGLNRCISSRLPSGASSRYSYDNNSNIICITNAIGTTEVFTYNAKNQQISRKNGKGETIIWEYDDNGFISQISDPNGNKTQFKYDAANQITDIIFPNGYSYHYTYDELGRVIEKTNCKGQSFRYEYDVLGRLLQKKYPDNTSDTFTYNAIGQLLSAINDNAEVIFTYDRLGRVMTETINQQMTHYSYDVASGKRSFTYPSGTRVVEQLNVRDQITNILENGEEVVSMNYNAAGQKISQTYANGITTNYSYDQNGWLNDINANHDVMHLQMKCDVLGNITERKDVLNSARSESYGYDVISQLTSFKRGTSVDNSYQFDPLGNRLSMIENGVTTNFRSNNVNAYTAITGGLSFTPQYDANGNLLNDDKHTYTYDFNNKLVTVDGSNGYYKYDALGRRIAKGNTEYYYVGDQLVEEVTAGTVTSYLYGNGIDEALQMKRGSATYYYHSNHLGSTMALTDAASAVVERMEYDAYGQPTFLDASGNILAQSSVGNNILFTGREYDTETSLYYYRSRNMSPALGQFIQRDPLGYINGLNDRIYVNNNPLNHKDAYGAESDNSIVVRELFDGRMVVKKPIANGCGPAAGGVQKSLAQLGAGIDAIANMLHLPPAIVACLPYSPFFMPSLPSILLIGKMGELLNPNEFDRINDTACYHHDKCYYYGIDKVKCDYLLREEGGAFISEFVKLFGETAYQEAKLQRERSEELQETMGLADPGKDFYYEIIGADNIQQQFQQQCNMSTNCSISGIFNSLPF